MNNQEQIKDKMRFLLEDTIWAFNITNRGVTFYEDEDGNEGDKEEMECVYLNKNTGNKCAIGRFIPDNDERFNDMVEENRGIDILTKKELNLLFTIDEFKGVPVDFLKSIQDLHDVPDNWDLEGLTSKGLEEREHIVRTFGL